MAALMVDSMAGKMVVKKDNEKVAEKVGMLAKSRV